jgi:hypothetical protein
MPASVIQQQRQQQRQQQQGGSPSLAINSHSHCWLFCPFMSTKRKVDHPLAPLYSMRQRYHTPSAMLITGCGSEAAAEQQMCERAKGCRQVTVACGAEAKQIICFTKVCIHSAPEGRGADGVDAMA